MPLPYQPENNDIPVQTPPTGFDALRTLAVNRICLDGRFSLAPASAGCPAWRENPNHFSGFLRAEQGGFTFPNLHFRPDG